MSISLASSREMPFIRLLSLVWDNWFEVAHARYEVNVVVAWSVWVEVDVVVTVQVKDIVYGVFVTLVVFVMISRELIWEIDVVEEETPEPEADAEETPEPESVEVLGKARMVDVMVP